MDNVFIMLTFENVDHELVICVDLVITCTVAESYVTMRKDKELHEIRNSQRFHSFWIH